MVPSPGFQSRFFVLANENRTQDAGHALLRQGRNPKVRKNSGVISAYTSSNYFSAQLASHLNAKVSPYLAFLTKMHETIPAISIPSSAGGNADEPVYLDAAGNRINDKQLSKEAKTMLHDYQLIQYDMSVGKNYLKDTGFVVLPQ